MNAFEEQQLFNQIRGLGNREYLQLAQQVQNNKAPGLSFSNDKFYTLKPFEIFAVFGDETDRNSNHTVKKIKDVYLTAQAQVISSSGEVIQEQYSFIARDIGDIE